MKDYNLYWEQCWQDEDETELYRYLDMYREMNSKEMEIFKKHNITKVCDAACGFGAYSLAYATNGFDDQAIHLEIKLLSEGIIDKIKSLTIDFANSFNK